MGVARITRWWSKAALVAAALLAPWTPASAQDQDAADRADTAIAAEQERSPEPSEPSRARFDAVAQQRNDATTPTAAFVAGAIRIDGAVALPQAAFARAIESYLGRTLSAEDLRALARDVAETARQAGYGLATAWVPPQTVRGGVLRVRLDEGRIDSVEASGPAGAAVERLLRRLTGGAPVATATLERQLLLAGDLAGVSVGQARLDRSSGHNVLRVETAFERTTGRASIDNWGTGAIGPVRARFAVEQNGVFALGDRASLGAVVTVLQPREFQLVQAAYSVPLGTHGTEATARVWLSHSDAGGELRQRDLEGDSVELEAGLSHPLLRSRAESLWGHVFLTVRDSELTRAGLPTRDDRLAMLSGTLYGTARLGDGYVRTRLSMVQGLDIFGATERGDPLASRLDSGGAFTKLAFWAELVQRLGAGFSVQASGEGQLASRPLLASEEMGLGGRAFLRGYDYREFAGDEGAAAGAELRYDLERPPGPLQRAQAYLYADAGRVTNLRGGIGGGSLASAGGGVRLDVTARMGATLEVAAPLTGDRYDTGDEAPRFSFGLVRSFR